MTDLFPAAAAVVLAEEGGYVNDPRDPGGETKYGISKRSYPEIDIAGLSRSEALAIYRKDFWQPCRCGELPWPLALALFDFAVNSGISRAVRTLQEALGGLQPDGIIGPKTLARAGGATDPLGDALDLCARRLSYLATVSTYDLHGLGWTRRVLRVLLAASSVPDSKGDPDAV